MGNIGSSELLIILVLALLLLGPKRLPEVGEALGRTLRRFRQASRELRDELDVKNTLDPSGDLRRELRDGIGDVKRSIDPTGELRRDADPRDTQPRATQPREVPAPTAAAAPSPDAEEGS